MRYSINLDCKTNYIGKDGCYPILLRVSLNGKHAYFNIGKRIKDTYYDRANKQLNRSKKGAGSYEKIIALHKQRISDIIDDYDKRGEIISLTELKRVYRKLTEGESSSSFYDYVQSKIAWEKQHTKIKKQTFKYYEGNLEKLKKYRKKLSFYDINEQFLNEYKLYLTKTLKQKDNTIYHAMGFIKKYTLQLVKDGLLNKNPLYKYEVGSPYEVDLLYLEPDELITLHNLYDSKKLLDVVKEKKSKYAKDFNIGVKYQAVLRYFLLSCYTGLRHSDIKTLTRDNIVGQEIVKKVVKGREGKQKTVRIPIIESASSLLEFNGNSELIFDSPVMEIPQTNKYLKDIMEKANINKDITFHKARYTFAINSLILGMSIVVVSDILGHSDLTVTQRYAKVVDTLKKSEMSKWDNFRTSTSEQERIILKCKNCNTTLLEVEIGVINQKHISCKCVNCNTVTKHQLSSIKPSNLHTQLSKAI
jgi:integrase